MTRVLISIPEGLLRHLDARAKKEYMTRSEMIRECFRAYLKSPETILPVSVLAGDTGEVEPNEETETTDE